MPEEPIPDVAPDLPPQFPIDPRKPMTGLTWLGFWLGVLGILCYGAALKLSVYGTLWFGNAPRVYARANETPPPHEQTLPALVGSVGIVLFMAAIALIWSFRLSTLLILAICSSVLVGVIPYLCKLGDVSW